MNIGASRELLLEEQKAHNLDIDMEDISLEQKILSELECPVCLEYLYPPIRQCIRGHTLCPSCFDKCSNCPVCRSPKGTSRCFALENIHSILIFPCKNKPIGCPYRSTGLSIKEHEESCTYDKECPLNIRGSCKWRGPSSEFLSHCKKEHENEVSTSNLQEFLWDDFVENDDVYFCELLQAYGHLFRFTWNMNSTTGVVKFCLYHLGHKGSKRFAYLIKFEANQVTTTRFVKQCEPYCESTSVLQTGSFLVVSLETIRKYRNRDGTLGCSLQIIDLSLDEFYLY